MRQPIIAILLAMGLFFSASAYATSVTFSFDQQLINGTTVAGLASGQTAYTFNGSTSTTTSGAIQNYMDAVLKASGCTGCTVTLSTGTSGNGVSMGAVADQTYSGENRVVGQVSGGVVHPVTLGTTNGATSNNPASGAYDTGCQTTSSCSYDTFIANTTDGSSQVSNQITMKFSGFTINGAAGFDYEIFPCGVGSCTPPDFVFDAGNGTNGVDSAVTSFGTNGTQAGLTPSSSTPSADGTSTKSCSGATTGCTVGTETSQQYIGTWSGTLTNDTELDFVDWPATIGVDNLTISYTTTAVPEPAGIALFGTLVVLLTKKLRRA